MLRTIAGCMPIHIARADDVTQRKLFAPSSPLFFVPQLNFMPAVGMYFVARQPQAGQETFRVYALPTSPPKDPFEIRTATTCTARVRSLATQALGELRAYFANGTRGGRAGRSPRTPPRAERGTSCSRAIRR